MYKIFTSKLPYSIPKRGSNIRLFSEDVHPFKRTWNVMSGSVTEFLGLKEKKPLYPEHVDVVIIGGGFIGSAAAYWLKTRTAHGLSVVVIEKDLTFEKAQKNVSRGVLVQNFSLPENIYLSRFGAEFLRNSKENLGSNVDINYRPSGYLVLACEKYAEKLEQTATNQREQGMKNEILSANEITRRYPWINTSDIKLGCMGLESEGLFNSWLFLKGLVQKSQDLGAVYINAEVTGFELQQQRDVFMEGVPPGSFQRINKVIYTTPDNEKHSIKFAACILAAGDESGEIAKLANVGVGEGILAVALPIEKRKSVIYSIEGEAKNTGLNTPVVMDSSGLWLQRNGIENNLIFGHIPFTTAETKNLTEEEYFKHVLEPSLYNRFPSIKDKKIEKLVTESQDFNTYDESGILGPHPYHNNLYIATGFGKYGCQHAPGIGKAIAELIIDSNYTSKDLTRLGFDRFMTKEPLIEYDVY